MRLLPFMVSIAAVAVVSATGCASISGLADLVADCDGSACVPGADGGGSADSSADGAKEANGSNDAASLPDGCVFCGTSTCCAQACMPSTSTCCDDVGAACNGGGGCCPHTYCPTGGGVCTACKAQNQPCTTAAECCSGTCSATNKCGDT